MVSTVLAVANDTGSVQAVTPVIEEISKRGGRTVFVIPVQRKIFEAKIQAHGQILIYFDGNCERDAALRSAILKFRPILILTGSSVPRHPDIPTAEQASTLLGREYNIPVVTILDAWGYYPERFGFLPSQKPYVPDLVCALDETCKQDLIKIGISHERIVITNNPWIDRFCSKHNKIESLEKNIIYVSQPLAESQWPRRWIYDQRDLFKTLMKALRDTPFKSIVHVWVHPSETVYSWHELVSEHPEMAKIQLDKSPESLVSADLLVTSHSTVVYQALHVGIPTIVLRPSFHDCDDHLPDKLGLTVKVSDLAALSNVLAHTLMEGAEELRKASIKLKTNNVFFSSGNATGLVMNAIEKYI